MAATLQLTLPARIGIPAYWYGYPYQCERDRMCVVITSYRTHKYITKSTLCMASSSLPHLVFFSYIRQGGIFVRNGVGVLSSFFSIVTIGGFLLLLLLLLRIQIAITNHGLAVYEGSLNEWATTASGTRCKHKLSYCCSLWPSATLVSCFLKDSTFLH